MSAQTQLFAIIGNPVKHSLSPSMYNLGFKELGLDYAYLAFEIPVNSAGEYLKTMRLLGIKGGNVTMPFKTDVMPFLDEISTEAKIIGAVNTLVNDNGVIKGYNTDGRGMVLSILDSGTQIKDRSVTIFGSGGAATAIIVALALEGARQIVVVEREEYKSKTLEQTLKSLNAEAPECEVSRICFENQKDFESAIRSSDIIINATPLGMKPNENLTPLEDTSLLRPDHTVVDAVYHPRKTRFLTQAQEAGSKTVEGTGMLLWQGVEAFRIFTDGQLLPVEKVKKEVFHIE